MALHGVTSPAMDALIAQMQTLVETNQAQLAELMVHSRIQREGLTPTGDDLETLRADAAAVTGAPTP